MNKYLFISADCIFDQLGESISNLFRPGVIGYLSRLNEQTDLGFVLFFTAPISNEQKKHIVKFLQKENIRFEKIIDKALLHQEQNIFDQTDRDHSFIISSDKADILFAVENQISGIFWGQGAFKKAVYTSTNWKNIYHFLRFERRIVQIERKTTETNIRVKLNLDGQGISRIKCPIGFLQHMLELFARHSGIDIDARIRGDTHVDEHHTIEDTAIVLGQAFYKAIGNKTGMNRYGFLLPMDEAHIEAAIDLSGRSFLTWKTKFKREKIGDMPTELFYHFFKSFTDHARCTLYVKARGENEHHLIEGIFKAVARAIKMAIIRDPDSQQIPSTKGVL